MHESMRKRIYLTETQYKLLVEAANDSFDLKILDTFKSLDDLSEYCFEHIGSVCENGSSRTVFVLDDNRVLKIAKDEKGLAQNEVEVRTYETTKSPLLAIIEQYGKDYSWIVAERAYRCVETDFEKIIGIPWGDYWEQKTVKRHRRRHPIKGDMGDKEVGFDEYFKDSKHEFGDMYDGAINVRNALIYIDYTCNEDKDSSISYSTEKAIKSSPWLTAMQEFVRKTHVSDIAAIDNYGIVHRNGQDMIVIIDSGFNMEIYLKYYYNG